MRISKHGTLVTAAMTLMLTGGALASASCSSAAGEEGTLAWSQDPLLGDALPGTDAGRFNAARNTFAEVETIPSGLGPIFNADACRARSYAAMYRALHGDKHGRKEIPSSSARPSRSRKP